MSKFILDFYGGLTVELLQLKYFLKVAETGNMTRAAEELFISQSSLSRTIARLEKELNTQLFDRCGRQIVINEFGKVFLLRVRQASIQLNEAIREIDDMLGNDSGGISVAITIPGILTHYVECSIEMDYTTRLSQFYVERGEVISSLTDGLYDFVITSSKVEHSKIVFKHLLHDRILAMVPKASRLSEKDSVSFHDLIGERIICSPQGFGLRPFIDDCFMNVGSMPNIVFEDSDPNLLIKMVKAGVGTAFISKHNLYHHLQTDAKENPDYFSGITLLDISDPAAEMDIGIAYLKTKYHTVIANKFITSLADYCTRLEESFNIS